MGNKIITEQDFWMCSEGLMPAQIQTIQRVAHKKTTTKYITEKDTATVSFADFACRKSMFIMAILVAVAAVVAAVIAATGGMALIAIGALAGAGGAALGAVVGGLLCGQIAAAARMWLNTKNNFKILGFSTITSASKMKCALFGCDIVHAPHIKNWWQALAMGGGNFLKGVLEGMFHGAMIGMGGSALSGVRTLFTAGGKELAKQGVLNFLKSAPRSMLQNFGEGFAGDGVMKGLDASQQWLEAYGQTGEGSLESFYGYIEESSFSDYNSVKNIFTGQGETSDYLAFGMLLMPGNAPKGGKGSMGIIDDILPNSKNVTNMVDDVLPTSKNVANMVDDIDVPTSSKGHKVGAGDVDGASTGKKAADADTGTSKKKGDADADTPDKAPKVKAQEGAEVAPKKKADGEAYEAGGKTVRTEQKKIIDDVESGEIELEGYEGHKKGNHTRKSNYGEMKMDEYMRDLGYEPLHTPIADIDQPIKQGIDGVYRHPGPPPKYAIGEAKYDTSKLSQGAKDGPQMSDDWIEGSKRLEKAVGKKEARKIISQGYDKVLVHTDKAGKVTANTVETIQKVDKVGNTVDRTVSGSKWP